MARKGSKAPAPDDLAVALLVNLARRLLWAKRRARLARKLGRSALHMFDGAETEANNSFNAAKQIYNEREGRDGAKGQ